MGKRERPGEARRSERIESEAERQIREAMEAGAFDHLEGKGKPIPGIDEPYDELWWVKRKLRREGFTLLPEAVAVRLDVERTVARAERLEHEEDVRASLEEVNERIRRLNATNYKGPASTLSPIDVEQAVSRWRERRRGGPERP
jgi:hypothetical protein